MDLEAAGLRRTSLGIFSLGHLDSFTIAVLTVSVRDSFLSLHSVLR